MSATNTSPIAREPVAIYAAVALIIVTLANVFGVVLDLSVVENVVLAIPVLVAALAARQQVTPV